ncbi:TPA: hypothetical protein OUF36_004784 [Enterobacter hormaechei]|nr:hypothetical protein [Enterobacter hormaechei]
MMIKLSDIAISLKNDFGASGNGIDDDTDSVRSFFNYLAINGGFGLVEPSEYNTLPIKIDGNLKSINIIGTGPDKCIFRNLSSSTFLSLVNCFDVNVFGVSIDCQYTKTKPITKMHGLVLASCIECSIHNCHVYDYFGTGILSYASNGDQNKKCKGLSIIDCVVKAEEAFKDWLSEPTETKKSKECNGVILADCDYSQIKGCRSEYISLFGIELKNNSKWNYVINCSAMNCKYGFGMGQETLDDTGCENNIVNGFMAENCYMGGILGKAKLNTISNFTVDFSDVPLSLIQNAFRFQLKSQFNSLSNLIVTGMLKGKGIIRYESGANNNTTQMTNCKKNRWRL